MQLVELGLQLLGHVVLHARVARGRLFRGGGGFHVLLQAPGQVLGKDEGTVIAFYYKEGLTMKEIGRVMSISESRVCQIHTKTLKKLKEHLDKLDQATGRPAPTFTPAATQATSLLF